jgi:hypothetical protein
MSPREKLARLTQDQAVTWVIAETRCRRPFALRTVREAEQGGTPYGMAFDGTHWTVPAWTLQTRAHGGK